MSLLELLLGRPPSAVPVEEPVETNRPVRAVIFEDDPLVSRLYRQIVERELGGEVLGSASDVYTAFNLVDQIHKGALRPNAAIVDRHLRASRYGVDSRRARILRETGADGMKIGTGNYIIYELIQARQLHPPGLLPRIIGISATDITDCDSRFWPDVSFIKPVYAEKKVALLRELRYAASLDVEG